ncbi:MAG: hypothetical protein IPO86_00275 [Saprospiraceae bacterium]|nr:hypothetical protein [Saprospiraceae bacterium]
MKSITLIIILLFGFGFLLQYSKIRNLNNQVSSLNDTIVELKILKSRYPRFSYISNEAANKINELQYFKPNDSISEIHRIIFSFGTTSKILKIECFKNDSIRLTYKLVTLKHPILGLGTDSLLKTSIQRLDKRILDEFKNKFSSISNYELTSRMDGESDCIGPQLSWEALIEFNHYEYSEICRKYSSFMHTCKLLMRHVGDQELQEILNQIENQEAKIK